MGMTLAEFLLARLAEDEAVARNALRGGTDRWRWSADTRNGGYPQRVVTNNDGLCLVAETYTDPDSPASEIEHIVRHDPARVLAEVEAKRRIVELHAGPHNCQNVRTGQVGWNVSPCTTLELLALPYADHADYEPDWRP